MKLRETEGERENSSIDIFSWGFPQTVTQLLKEKEIELEIEKNGLDKKETERGSERK